MGTATQTDPCSSPFQLSGTQTSIQSHTWNDFLFAVVLTSTQARTITVGATSFITSSGVLWGDVSAATVLSVTIPVFFAVFAQRYLVSGLAAGATKG